MSTVGMHIRVYGDECLRKKSEPLGEVGVSERVFIDAMVRTMYEADGVGLAAPQIGINKQLFVAEMGEGPIVVINPEIVKSSGSECMEEGCLSFPGLSIKIDRSKNIVVKYKDQDNALVTAELSDLPARIFQHEHDHLCGKLIIDYSGPNEKKALAPQLKEIQEGSTKY